MFAEIKERWVEALRSGKFKQGQEMLSYEIDGETKHCCLGVLCDLYNKEKHRSWADLHINGDEILPKKVAHWAGLRSQNPNVTYAKTVTTLSAFNDGNAVREDKNDEVIQLDFNGIADLIEAQL